MTLLMAITTGVALAVALAAVAGLERLRTSGQFCRVRGHDWEWGLGPCLDCGADNPDDPTREAP